MVTAACLLSVPLPFFSSFSPFSVFIAVDCYVEDRQSEQRTRKHRGVLICQYAADDHKSLNSHISASQLKIKRVGITLTCSCGGIMRRIRKMSTFARRSQFTLLTLIRI